MKLVYPLVEMGRLRSFELEFLRVYFNKIDLSAKPRICLFLRCQMGKEELLMNTKQCDVDLVQRIAECVNLTAEPRPSSDGTNPEGFTVVGSVPLHLRHLHNLLDDLRAEAYRLGNAYMGRMDDVKTVRSLFFASLKTHVPDPDDADAIKILENWDIVAVQETDAEKEMDPCPSGRLLELMSLLNNK